MKNLSLHNIKGVVTINLNCHPMTFKKIWKELCESFVTCSAVKYANVRRSYGVYVIDGEEDVVHTIYRGLQTQLG